MGQGGGAGLMVRLEEISNRIPIFVNKIHARFYFYVEQASVKAGGPELPGIRDNRHYL